MRSMRSKVGDGQPADETLAGTLQETQEAKRRAGRAGRWAALALICALAACSSTPAPRLHSLLGSDRVTPVDGAALPGGVAAAASTPIGAFILEPIRVPAAVDQPQWLVRVADDTLVSLESERWASPLRDEFRQAVLVELAGRFRLVDARDDRAFAPTAWRVRIDVLRFESIAGREARIEGAWTLTAPTPSAAPIGVLSPSATTALTPLPAHCHWQYAEPVGAGMAELAAAHRKNVSRLADHIGAAILARQRGERVACAND